MSDEFVGLASGSLASYLTIMTPPFGVEPYSERRRFVRKERPKKLYKRVYLITTAGRDNLEREILSDLEEPDLNIVVALGMSFVRANFHGQITRAGSLLIEWAYLRGFDFTYKEKRLMAHAHFDIWQQQGLSGELYHLKRSRSLFEEILELPAFSQDMPTWTEYLRVLLALGTRKTIKVCKHIANLANENNDQDLAEFNFYAGAILKEHGYFHKASDRLFEAAELGPPRLFKHIEVMFIVARNVNEGDARAKEMRGQHDDIHHDYSSVYQNFLADRLIPKHISYDQWVSNKATWRLISEKCSIHGMYSLAQDMLSQCLVFDEKVYQDATIWFRLAKLFFRSGRLPDALSSLTQALARDPQNRQYKSTKEIWLAKLNTFEYAINMCSIDEILNMLPHPHDLHVPAANRLRSLHKISVKKWDKAMREKEAERLAALAAESDSGPAPSSDEAPKKRVKDKSKKNPRILWRTPAPIIYPSKLTPKITSATVKDIEGEFEYRPSLLEDPLPAGTHRIFCEFIPSNTNKYNIVEAEVNLVVEKATPYVRWLEPPFLYLGSKMTPVLHLNALVCEEEPGGGNVGAAAPQKMKGKMSKKALKEAATSRFGMVSRMGTESGVMGQPAGTYTYKIDGKNKKELQPQGVLLEDIALPLGVHDLIVTFTPDDLLNYTRATAKTKVLVVPKIVPQITWPTPEAITYRTRLQSMQLNATCAAIEGTFFYFRKIFRSERRRKQFGGPSTPRERDPEDGQKHHHHHHHHYHHHQHQQQQQQNNSDGGTLAVEQEEEDESYFEMVEWTELESIGLGSLLEAGENTLVCMFEPLDSVKYTHAEASNMLVVKKYQTLLLWNNPPCIYVGTRLDFQEHLTSRLIDDVDGNGSGKFTYTCTVHDYISFPDDAAGAAAGDAEAEVTLSNTAAPLGQDSTAGTISLIGLLPKGHHKLHVEYTPLDLANYFGCTFMVPITVRCKPVIVWEKPQAIRYGMLISEIQYNAYTADCMADLTYEPAMGAKLEIGHYMLKVLLTPHDLTVHDTAHAMVPLSVIRKLVPVLSWIVKDIVYGELVDERVLCCVADVPGTFKYNVAMGQQLEAGSHSIIATFFPEDSATYSNGSTVEQLIVHQQQVEIIWDPLCAQTGLMSISYGVPVTENQLCTLVTHPAPEDIPSLFGTMSYSVEEGDLLQSGVHAITATFTPSPRYVRNYKAGTVSAKLEIRRFTPTLRWARPPGMVFGMGALSEDHLNATIEMSTFSVALDQNEKAPEQDWEGDENSLTHRRTEKRRVLIEGTLTYVPGLGEALPGAGKHTLRVVFTPYDSFNFGSAEATVVINVAQSRPVISWSTPNFIYWGQVLSKRQLNATVACPGLLATDGVLVYTPGRAEALPVGTHILRVEFVPYAHTAKNFDCTDLWAQVVLTVKPKPFNTESLDRLMLCTKQASLHQLMHSKKMQNSSTTMVSYPEIHVERPFCRPTSAPYATLHNRERIRLAWPAAQQSLDGSQGHSSVGTLPDDWIGQRVSNSLRNASFSPNASTSLFSTNASVVSNFNSSKDGDRRISSANNAVGSPLRRPGVFPPLFDEDGALIRPVTADRPFAQQEK